MNVEERIRECLLLEKMRNNEDIARELGLVDVSEVKQYDVQKKGDINMFNLYRFYSESTVGDVEKNKPTTWLVSK